MTPMPTYVGILLEPADMETADLQRYKLFIEQYLIWCDMLPNDETRLSLRKTALLRFDPYLMEINKREQGVGGGT